MSPTAQYRKSGRKFRKLVARTAPKDMLVALDRALIGTSIEAMRKARGAIRKVVDVPALEARRRATQDSEINRQTGGPPTRREVFAEAATARLAKLAAIKDHAVAKGWRVETESSSGSLYLRTRRGYLIRISDHTIPITDERMAA